MCRETERMCVISCRCAQGCLFPLSLVRTHYNLPSSSSGVCPSIVPLVSERLGELACIFPVSKECPPGTGELRSNPRHHS